MNRRLDIIILAVMLTTAVLTVFVLDWTPFAVAVVLGSEAVVFIAWAAVVAVREHDGPWPWDTAAADEEDTDGFWIADER